MDERKAQFDAMNHKIGIGQKASALVGNGGWDWLSNEITEAINFIKKEVASEKYIHDQETYILQVGSLKGLQKVLDLVDNAIKDGQKNQQMLSDQKAAENA